MRFAVGVLICLSAGAVSPALADPPATPTAPVSEATPPASAPAVDPATAASKPAVDPEENRLISEGYKLEMRNGQKVFCRREALLGSRFETKLCATAEQLKSVRQSGKDIVEEAQRHRITPDKQ